MDRFSELRSGQDREILARDLLHRHTATPPRVGRGRLGRLLGLVRARRAAVDQPAPRGCAPAHEA